MFSLSAGDLVVVSNGNYFRRDTPKLGIVLEDAPKGFTFAKIHYDGETEMLLSCNFHRIEEWKRITAAKKVNLDKANIV